MRASPLRLQAFDDDGALRADSCQLRSAAIPARRSFLRHFRKIFAKSRFGL
jgi:hypothetical protein